MNLLAALVFAGRNNTNRGEGMREVVLNSVVTCPHCGFREEETMPAGSCQFFYECANCKTVLRSKPGDCCVYCSYGTVRCPSKQRNGADSCC